MARVPLSAAVPRPPKPKLPTKTKATPTPHMCSYSLRARAGSTAAELHQAQPAESVVSWDIADHSSKDIHGLTQTDGPYLDQYSDCHVAYKITSSSHACRAPSAYQMSFSLSLPVHAQVVLSSAVVYVGVRGMLPAVQDLQGNPGECESVPEMYDDSSVITYVCQAHSPSRYSAHQLAHSNLKHRGQTTRP